jgi:hypothetical protein
MRVTKNTPAKSCARVSVGRGARKAGTYVVVAEALVEAADGEEECGQLEDAAEAEEGGEAVRNDHPGEKGDVSDVVAALTRQFLLGRTDTLETNIQPVRRAIEER